MQKNQFDSFDFQLFLLIVLVMAATSSADEAEAEEDASAGTPEFDGASYKLTNTDLGVEVTFFGTGLSGTPATNTFAGTVQSFSVANIGSSKPASTILLPVATSLQDLNDAADAVPATPNPKNAKGFLELLMPKGSPFPNLDFIGHNGKDIGLGFGGDDSFVLKGGDDIVFASRGDDTVQGGTGNDTFDARYINTGSTIDLGKGTVKMGKHSATLTKVENAVGTNKDDSLIGNGKANALTGRGGNDTLVGKGGNDNLDGGQGKDVLRGGSGKDKLTGGQDNDKLIGGGGPDTFFFSDKKGADNGTDRIKDWQEGIDKIQIKGGKPSEVKVTTKSGNTIVTYDEGKIVIEDETLTKGDIDFLF